MSIQVSIRHYIIYKYDKQITLSPYKTNPQTHREDAAEMVIPAYANTMDLRCYKKR